MLSSPSYILLYDKPLRNHRGPYYFVRTKHSNYQHFHRMLQKLAVTAAQSLYADNYRMNRNIQLKEFRPGLRLELASNRHPGLLLNKS